MIDYQPVIGLEVHVELKTKSKMFCQCAANYFGKPPNTNTCPVCLGLPGALPVPNQKAIEWTVLIGRALNCHINLVSKFDRKHYFYPDLAKGYQISQYDEPIATKGWLKIKNQISNIKVTDQKSKREQEHRVRINRVHLEEDTGKLVHQSSNTLVDFNRSGVPLVEIVTEPDFTSADEVKVFLEELHTIIRYLGVSDADMEKGTMRMEPNISLKIDQRSNIKDQNDKSKIKTDSLPNYKVEVKNINSFRFVKQAIEYELKRQEEILEKGQTPVQETRGFDEKRQVTYPQRTKEQAHDYRYFPEPDIPPLHFAKDYIEQIQSQLPELPEAKLDRFVNELGLRYGDAFILTREKATADYFEAVLKILGNQGKVAPQQTANLLINKKISSRLDPQDFVKKAMQLLFPQTTDIVQLTSVVKTIIASNPKVVADYNSGKKNAIMYLVGQVMREMKGQVEVKLVIEKLKQKLTYRN